MKQVLIIGSDGQLGHEIEARARVNKEISFTFTTLNELDITNESQLRSIFASNRFEIVVNCAAYTDVNKSETEVDLAQRINGEAPGTIGLISHTYNCKVIHISTDYVFDGMTYRPYKESDPVHPLSVYGKTKLSGEQNLLRANPQSVIIRTSWLYSSYGNNFVKTMIRLGREKEELKVVYDQIGTPTYAGDLAEVVLSIVNKSLATPEAFVPGIYHYSNEGVCSWYDFAIAIHKYARIDDCRILPIESSEFPSPAPRPHYSVMNKSRIKEAYSIQIPHWELSLIRCIQELNKP